MHDQDSVEVGREHRADSQAEMETHSELSAAPSFTPGPWRVREAGAIFSEPFPPKCIAYISEMESQTSDDEREANRCLIAAAPALYAALREAELRDHKGMPEVATHLPDCIGCIAHAALKLADGQDTNTSASDGTT